MWTGRRPGRDPAVQGKGAGLWPGDWAHSCRCVCEMGPLSVGPRGWRKSWRRAPPETRATPSEHTRRYSLPWHWLGRGQGQVTTSAPSPTPGSLPSLRLHTSYQSRHLPKLVSQPCMLVWGAGRAEEEGERSIGSGPPAEDTIRMKGMGLVGGQWPWLTSEQSAVQTELSLGGSGRGPVPSRRRGPGGEVGHKGGLKVHRESSDGRKEGRRPDKPDLGRWPQPSVPWSQVCTEPHPAQGLWGLGGA